MLTETFSSVVSVISEDKPFPDGQESCLATEWRSAFSQEVGGEVYAHKVLTLKDVREPQGFFLK